MAADGQTLYASPRMATLLGATWAPGDDRQTRAVADPSHVSHLAERLMRLSKGEARQFEIDVTLPTGERRQLRVSTSPLSETDDGPHSLLVLATDVSEPLLWNASPGGRRCTTWSRGCRTVPCSSTGSTTP